MIKKIALLLNTVKHLKPIQVFYQFKYRIKKAGALSSYNKAYTVDSVCFLSFTKQPPVYKAYLGHNIFSFLNLVVDFKKDINWNYQEHGKLWNYNLQYANYLLQEEVSVIERETLLLSLYTAIDKGELALEPYPVSLRCINSIRFISQNNREEQSLYPYLHAELDFLSKRPEYHLLGNHLLENGFALLMGGAFFVNQTWIKQGQQILKQQLEEQIMKDGAHFELSPMYHQIIFFRLLELIDWYSNWEYKDKAFLHFLMNKASKMYSWLAVISFKDGAIPHFNDSANGIAYSTPWLLEYADKLGVKQENILLNDSGYRSYTNDNYECKIDLAQIGPSYQPGHAQADALSFILNYKNKPLFVEVGTSTYEINEIRAKERGTAGHNTVVVNNTNQSNVWSGFRVAQRAKTIILEDRENYLVGQHDGYKKIGNIHKRVFDFKEKRILINDTLEGNPTTKKQFHLHLDPSVVDIQKEEHTISLIGIATINFEGATKIAILDYNMADGYNRYQVGKKIVVTFVQSLKTIITFKE